MRLVLVMFFSVFMIISGAVGVTSDTNAEECPIVVSDTAPDGFADSTRPVMSATFTSKCGNDIDIQSVKMLFNDEEVSCKVSGTGSKITIKFVPEWNLAQESDHFVKVGAKDKSGNEVKAEWSFWLGLIY